MAFVMNYWDKRNHNQTFPIMISLSEYHLTLIKPVVLFPVVVAQEI
jgi:hypothetical protein